MSWGAAGEQQVPRAPSACFGMTMALGRNDNKVRAEGQRRKRARADEMEAQRGARPSLQKAVLQKSLRPKPCDWIDYYLPLENPAGHRKANRRIKQMHLSHLTPPISGSITTGLILRGGTNIKLYRHNSNPPASEQGTTVLSKWHGSNRRNGES